MKNILLILFIVMTPLLSSAQTFLTQTGTDSSTALFTGASELFVNNYLRSASATPVVIKWHVSDYKLGTNWKVTGFCDNYTCYTNDPAKPVSQQSVLNGTEYRSLSYTNAMPGGDFHIIYDATTAAVGSSSWVQVFAFDTVGAGYGRNMIFIGRKTVTGVTTQALNSDDVVVYPNPASNSVNVIFDPRSDVKTIAVYNLIGKLMGPVYVPSSNTSARIDLEQVPNGIYFIRMMNSQGHVIATRRFTHQ